MRKLKFAIISTVLCGLLFVQIQEVHTQSALPPAGKTGAPGETTCGEVACHNTTPNTGPGNVAISFSSSTASYIPDTTYQLTVTVSQADIHKFGFEATAIDSIGNRAGNFSLIDLTNTSLPLGGFQGRQYVGHRFASAVNTWTVNWTAPDHNMGPVTFYAAGNAANGNIQNTGDEIYTSSMEIAGEFGTAALSPSNSSVPFQIVNPALNAIDIKYQLNATGPVTIFLYDETGRLIQQLWNGEEVKGLQTHSFPVRTFVNPGVYLLQLNIRNNSHSEKIFIQ
ncbi:MAG: T9SS type A sorting domain-containing protein [Chitinophagales bacterium]|nr:T9SS type A sorting domain-containing protein [Chitinophagales bacterium]